jgi:hypothetical protein
LDRGVIAELGEKDGFAARIKDSLFGVYINWEKVNAKLPVDYAGSPETIPLEEAWFLILEKGETSRLRKREKSNCQQRPNGPNQPISTSVPKNDLLQRRRSNHWAKYPKNWQDYGLTRVIANPMRIWLPKKRQYTKKRHALGKRNVKPFFASH